MSEISFDSDTTTNSILSRIVKKNNFLKQITHFLTQYAYTPVCLFLPEIFLSIFQEKQLWNSLTRVNSMKKVWNKWVQKWFSDTNETDTNSSKTRYRTRRGAELMRHNKLKSFISYLCEVNVIMLGHTNNVLHTCAYIFISWHSIQNPKFNTETKL